MAKGSTVARTAVTARGTALLALIAAAEGGFLMLTQDEGAEAVAAGHAAIDPAIPAEGETAAVRLTEAGSAVLSAENSGGEAGGNANVAETTFELDSDVPMPGNRQRKGRESTYPFDKMEVGQSFHVAKTEANPKPADRLASSVSGARAKYAEATGETETVKVNVYKRGEDGKSFVKVDGKRVVEGTKEVTRPKMKLIRDFAVYTVGADDPKGEGARVFRTL